MEAGGCARTGAGSGRPVLLAQGQHGAAMVWCCTISSSRTRAAEDVHWYQTITMGNARSMAGRHRDAHPPAAVCSEKSAPAVSDATTPTRGHFQLHQSRTVARNDGWKTGASPFAPGRRHGVDDLGERGTRDTTQKQLGEAKLES